MENEELTKLIATLGKLGYRVISVNPETVQLPDMGPVSTGATVIKIEPPTVVRKQAQG